jgi:hypothetical protein
VPAQHDSRTLRVADSTDKPGFVNRASQFAFHGTSVDWACFIFTNLTLEGRNGMGLLAQLWLPIVLSAVFVFIASSILHMVLKFWHGTDGKGFSNEDEVGAAIRKGNATAGMYMIPYCKPETMKEPAAQEKFKLGPVGVIFLRQPGVMNMGTFLGQWFVFCLVISFL